MSPDDPRHGRNEGYSAGCRDLCCRTAHTKHRNWLRLYPNPMLDATGTRRRVEALACLGWAMYDISVRLGRHPTWCQRVVSHGQIHPATAAAISDLYDDLSMSIHQGPHASRTMGRARRLGYAPPLAWDEGTIDDPDARPYKPRQPKDQEPDPVVVARILGGENLPARHADRLEVVARWQAAGRPLRQLEILTGWNTYLYKPRPTEAAS